MKRAILEVNGVSMAMMIVSNIKLLGGLIYVILGLSNHLIYHKHNNINTNYIWSHCGG